MTTYSDVPNAVSFPALELEVLKRWTADGTFERSVAQREGAPPFVFFDGPPFATGLPHYGHILTSYIKDSVPRYFTMRGYHVPRRWGWDCHGLPVEFEVEKKLGFGTRADIVAYGIGRFNEACRSLVLRYQNEWREIIGRLGRWVDFDNAYKTMDADYMESVVRCFHDLHRRNLVYEGNKVVAYCVRCQTALSNFEARLDDAYRERDDAALTVRFRLAERPREALLAWTTTGWTLPSNVALGVNAEIEYSRYEKDGESVWIASAAAERYARELEGYEAVERRLGSAFVGVPYEPPFSYFRAQANAFVVIAAGHVTAEDGTGIVHLAPAFGEEDQVACAAAGVEGPNPVRDDGRFDDSVGDLAGIGVFEANEVIARSLKISGLLFAKASHRHSYPHCWRCDSPLIYRAIRTWFVNVTAFKERMIAANRKIRWVPEHIQEGRFGDWLAHARDWAISRNRFWGAPIPVWRCSSCGRVHVVGSRAELEKLSGKPVEDWHRPAIDGIRFPCPAGDGEMVRVEEVLDCWFESGAMPYAQVHYPFERKEAFERSFPGDFIVEYISQTRGWFYTLVVLSSALFDGPPFKTAVCHGVILGDDGRKLSKRLKNYPDPTALVAEHGSDAMRIALLSSGAVSGNDIRFSGAAVRDAVRRFHLPLWNALHLFTSYATIDGFEPSGFPPAPTQLDRYLLSEVEALRELVESSMERYDFPRAYGAIEDFITTLSTWYVRLTRSRLWSSGLDDDKRSAYEALHAALTTLAKISAPFVPFLAESIHAALGASSSVHLADWPAPRPDWRDDALMARMHEMRSAVRLARRVRERNQVKHRHPLRTAWICGIPRETVEDYRELLESELNVKGVRWLASPDQHVERQIALDYAKLGKRLRGDVKKVAAAVSAGDYTMAADSSLTVAGHVLSQDEYTVRFVARDGALAAASEGNLVVLLDLAVDEQLVTESLVRDLNRVIQDLRKRARLAYEERIEVSVTGGPEVAAALDVHGKWLAQQVLAVAIGPRSVAAPLASVEADLGGGNVRVAIARSALR